MSDPTPPPSPQSEDNSPKKGNEGEEGNENEVDSDEQHADVGNSENNENLQNDRSNALVDGAHFSNDGKFEEGGKGSTSSSTQEGQFVGVGKNLAGGGYVTAQVLIEETTIKTI
jgi:hypothetical protein